MKFALLINLKLLAVAFFFLLNIAEHENFSNKCEKATVVGIFIFIRREISCSAEHEKHFIPSGPDQFGISFVSVHGVSSAGEWMVCSTCKIVS